jgi:hypothetical protein
MPIVPTYNGPQVARQVVQPNYQNNVDVSSGTRALAQGLGQASEVADRIVTRDAETEALTAQAKIADDFDKWDSETRTASQGVNAKGYRAKVDEWWTKAKETYTDTLSPRAQQAIGKSLATVRNTTLRSASDYETQQREIGATSALGASVNGLVKQSIKLGPDAGPVILDQAAAQVRAFYKARGLDGDAAALKVTTGAHATQINQLMQRDPKAAEVYFNTHKESGIDPTQWDEISGRINQVSAITDGEGAAGSIWSAMVKPGYNNPVDLSAMETQVREQFKNDPSRQKAGIAALRERKQAWDESQKEFNAANTNGVYAVLDAPGGSLSKAKRSEAWAALPAVERDRIEAQQESRAATQESREAARATRALANDQRSEKRLLLSNAEGYLAATDPETLVKKTRAQVQAMRTEFGFEATQQLLNRYDQLQKPGAVAEAKMDTEEFNHVAEQLKLDPYNTRSPAQKAALGDLKFRVERLIDQRQRDGKKTLTRQEKADLMVQEMTRKVTVDAGFFSSERQVPVVQLSSKDLENIVVPAAERPVLASEMQQLYAIGQNPLYAPTEINLKRYLATKKSAGAASLIGTE